ncbi:hypothetical protein PLICRDRAFT_695048 [Plicaturopsis crispa FD-325 SS-3]|nr:hypothetical protein PLICRDRAFT_695048 [Plicaturopsis crispa FD-325 SS-3]
MSSLLKSPTAVHTVHSPAFSRPSTPGGVHATQIGFVGLGAMGYFMARNLANRQGNAGLPALLVYNRTVAKSEKLRQEVGDNRVRVASSLGQVATECDVIITNLANDDVVRATYAEYSAALSHSPPTKNKIFVETSTIYPTVAGEIDQLITSHVHSHLITSPVFGAPTAADAAQLIIIMSGDYRSKKELAYILVPAVGRKIVDLGGNLEKAPTFKLIGNSMILGSLEVLAEAFTLADKSGIDAANINNLVKDLLPAPPLVAYGDKMVNDAFDGSKGFAIDGGIKDASHIRNLTTHHNSPMPTIDNAHQHLLTARALHQSQVRAGTQKYDTLDWSAIVAGTRVAAGLDGLESPNTRVVRDD